MAVPPKILVDTDILSYYLKGYPEVLQSLDDHENQHDGAFPASPLLELGSGFVRTE